MKRRRDELVCTNYLETFMHGIFPHKMFDKDPDLEFTSDEHGTVITKRVFTSEIFQTLLEDKINGLY